MKRLFVLLVTMAMLFSFSACAQTETEDPLQSETEVTTTASQTTKSVTTTKAETTTQAQTTTQIVNPFAEKMEINWLVGTYTSHLYEEGRWDELELEEKFNVDLKMWNILVDSKNMEQVQMMLAAGDVPDYGFYYTTGQYLYAQGLSRTVPMSMIKQYYPSYYKALERDPLGFHFNKVEGTEDEYYALTIFSCMATHTGHVPMWRLDWLESLGYKLDNLTVMDSAVKDEWDNRLYFTTTKFSIDDVKEVLRAFTEDDPDGNGVDDTYGTGFSDTWYDGYISYCMFGFDIDGNHLYLDPLTGDYVPYYAYSPYKDMFKFLSEMLDKGYMRWIPKELAYNIELRNIWATGKTGYMNTLSGGRLLGYVADNLDYPPQSILANEPNATFVVTPVPGDDGKYRPYSTYNWGPYMYPIGINVSDDKLIRIFHLLEYAYFGDDWLRYKFGIEGVHYKWAGESFNSPVIMTDATKIPAKYAGKGTTTGFGQFGNINFISDNKVYMSFDAFSIQFMDFWDKYNAEGYKGNNLWIRPDKYYSNFTMPLQMYTDFTKLKNETQSQINTVHSSFKSKVWSGQIGNIETEWEQYIDQIYAAGLEEWVEVWNNDDIKTFQYYSGIK